MKTRQELILDFMLALVGNSDYCQLFPTGEDDPDIMELNDAQRVYAIAASLADEYLENL
jgi:hypothetical protein